MEHMALYLLCSSVTAQETNRRGTLSKYSEHYVEHPVTISTHKGIEFWIKPNKTNSKTISVVNG